MHQGCMNLGDLQQIYIYIYNIYSEPRWALYAVMINKVLVNSLCITLGIDNKSKSISLFMWSRLKTTTRHLCTKPFTCLLSLYLTWQTADPASFKGFNSHSHIQHPPSTSQPPNQNFFPQKPLTMFLQNNCYQYFQQYHGKWLTWIKHSLHVVSDCFHGSRL